MTKISANDLLAFEDALANALVQASCADKALTQMSSSTASIAAAAIIKSLAAQPAHAPIDLPALGRTISNSSFSACALDDHTLGHLARAVATCLAATPNLQDLLVAAVEAYRVIKTSGIIRDEDYQSF